jgi:hypothetical protein
MPGLRDLLVVSLATGLTACGGAGLPPAPVRPGDTLAAAVRPVCGTETGSATGFVALHRYAQQEESLVTVPAPDRDEASVAILHDHGDLVIRRNLFDLDGRSVRLAPGAGGGYDVTRSALGLEAPGNRSTSPQEISARWTCSPPLRRKRRGP